MPPWDEIRRDEVRREEFIFDESNENRRIRKIIIDAFVRNKWNLLRKDKIVQGVPLVDGIFVHKDGYLEKRA